MLKKVFESLDKAIEEENNERRADGRISIKQVVIKVVGQSALIESELDLELLATNDVDAIMNAEHFVQKKFNELLAETNKHWDTHSHEIWMPDETEYDELYSGQFVNAELARPEYVLLSKALKAPDKNRNLIIEYLAKEPSKLFMNLVKRYRVDLKQFL